MNDFKWHKFPDELPKDGSTVLTVAKNENSEGEYYYHTFTFSNTVFETMTALKRNPSLSFFGWSADRYYDVTAWTYIPEYEDK